MKSTHKKPTHEACQNMRLTHYCYLLALGFLPVIAFAQDNATSPLQVTIDVAWAITVVALAFLMQAGFTLLESGISGRDMNGSLRSL